jgi:hypothetical protein
MNESDKAEKIKADLSPYLHTPSALEFVDGNGERYVGITKKIQVAENTQTPGRCILSIEYEWLTRIRIIEGYLILKKYVPTTILKHGSIGPLNVFSCGSAKEKPLDPFEIFLSCELPRELFSLSLDEKKIKMFENDILNYW